jgi:hypothetical protein
MAGPAVAEPLEAARLMNELMSCSLFSSAHLESSRSAGWVLFRSGI